MVFSASSDLHGGKVWYTPLIKFTLAGLPATLRLNVNSLFSIDTFSLEIDGHLLYSEGGDPMAGMGGGMGM